MAIRRSELIDNETPGFYHLSSRCVRRAFLCGVDEDTGISYEHRRAWIEKRILFLAELFAIEVYSYAVMHNHYHLVVYFNPKAPWQWSDNQVVERWLRLYPIRKNKNNVESLTQAKRLSILSDKGKVEACRQKLGSISRLMSCINEPLAKRSNLEDGVKGHFWESRFHSQALLDESAALTCMAYVDLNPIRAGLNQKLEHSEHTSIQTRIKLLSQAQLNQAIESIKGGIKEKVLSIKLKDYIELVEWTGKTITHDNKASIPTNLTPIFQRLNLNQDEWLSQVKAYRQNYYRAVGSIEAMQALASKLKQQWVKGVNSAKLLYASP